MDRFVLLAAASILAGAGVSAGAKSAPATQGAYNNLTPGQWVAFLSVMIVLIALIAFFAASETALLRVRDSRIAQLVDEGDPRAHYVQKLKDNPERMLVSIQIVVTLVTTLASSLATTITLQVLHGISRGWAITISTIFVLFFLSLFGEITPKNWALGHSERWALFCSKWVNFTSTVIVGPLAWLLETLSAQIIKLIGGHRPSNAPYATEEEIKLIVEEAAGFGELEEEEKEMIHKVMEIPGITAREIMTPRIQIVAVEMNTPISEVVSRIMEEGHTRIPVYRGSVDEIVGILHAKDLLTVLGNGECHASLEGLIKEPLQIPESKKVDKLLQEFKAKKAQMAVVLDEYGGTAGLVTMEDVLEEIVGPIEDEYDEPEEKDIQTLAPGEYLVAGGAALEDVCEILDFEVKEDDSDGTDTVGGLVFGLLGRVPEVGDAVEYGPWRLLVEKVESRRVERLRITHHNSGIAKAPVKPEANPAVKTEAKTPAETTPV